MAAISRRPRLTLGTVVMVAVAGCSLVKPIETPADKQTEARNLSSEGKHVEAAQAYAELADALPANHDNYELLSAEQWVAAGNLAGAKQALAAVSSEARSTMPASRALVAAEIAVAENDGSGALRELDAVNVPTAAELAQNYYYLRGKAAFLMERPVDGTRAFIERERYLMDSASLRSSREELLSAIRRAAERGQSLNVPAGSDAVLAGWLQLGPVVRELQRDPMRAAAALDAWRRLYPQHPATESMLPLAQNQIAVAGGFPDEIALLLPLSGRAEAVGVAVRDGFIAAYLEQAPASRPHVAVYDVAQETVAGAFQHAMQDGAAFIVGPLTKEDVAALAPLSAGRVPVLALNFLSEAVPPMANFYQFALWPEDEARIVARRLAAEGKLRGVAIVPAGEWGTRVAAAFSDELTQLGGIVLDSGRYETGRADFSDVIKQTLQVRGAKGEPASHRSDAAFVFVAGTPSVERLMISQLKFHYAGDIPAYATSDSFEPDPAANGDLDGLYFPDMPWMVSTDPVTSRIRDAVRGAWPTRTTRRDRLYAFGFDAYRLVPALRAKSLSGTGEIAGVSGKLRLDDRNRVRRELDWAQIKNGVPAAL